MIKYKKIIIYVFLLILYVLNLHARRKEITIWCSDKELSSFEWIKKIYKKEKRIVVNIEIQSEVRSKYLQSAKAGTGPDIIVGANDWVGQLASYGLLHEIKIDVNNIKNEFYPAAIDGFIYEEKLYGIPYCIEALILFYNKSMISSPPETFEELLSAAKKINNFDKRKYGFLYCIDSNLYTNFPFIGSQGGYIFKWDGKKYNLNDIGLNNSGAIKGAEFIRRLVTENILPISANSGMVETSFSQEQAAMVIDGPWNISNYKNALGSKLGAAKIPALYGKKSVPFVGARGLMISSFCKNVKDAEDLILNYLCDYEGQMKIFESGGRPPANIKANNKAQQKDYFVQVVTESAMNGIAMPNVKEMSYVWAYGGSYINELIINKNVSVRETLNQLVEKIFNKIK